MSRFSVLIVDDDDNDRFFLKRLLRRAQLGDITIFEETDGQRALDFFLSYEKSRESALDDYPPLVLFLDINMPIVDGFAFLEKFSQLRTQLCLESMAVLMFSSSNLSTDQQNALSYDFVSGYLVKGKVDETQLKEVITPLLDR